MSLPVDPTPLLRSRGLRVRSVRIAVLEAVRELPHAAVDRVIATVAERLGSVSKQAVYDALDALVRADILRRIEPANSPARYEARVGDNHHHVVCRSCGVIADVECAVGETPCLTASDSGGAFFDLPHGVAENAIDGYRSTSWLFGDFRRAPGTTLTLDLPEPRTLDELSIDTTALGDVTIERNRGIVSVVGNGLSDGGATMSTALGSIGDLHVHMLSLSSSGINLTVVLDGDQVSPAMRRLHEAFFPEQP